MSFDKEGRLEQRRRLPRQDAAAILTEIAGGLARGRLTLEQGERGLHLNPCSPVRLRLHADAATVRLQLTWTPRLGTITIRPVGCSAEELRTAFREAVFLRDYQTALEVGDRILRRLPDSEMARQFRTLRPLLQRHVT